MPPGSAIPSTAQPDPASIETAKSWVVAAAVLAILTFTYGAPLVVAVGLKDIAADLGSARAVPAFAGAVVWMGFGLGAIGMGWIADRIGCRWTTVFGALMVGAGMALSTLGGAGYLVLGHALLIGMLGGGAINIPLTVYVTRWFDRRRGSAVALVQSGQYIAGALWPSLLALGIASFGWRSTMLLTGLVVAVAIVPIALICLPPAPEPTAALSAAAAKSERAQTLGLSRGATFALLCVAGFLCCTPMAMPPTHLVALCSDLGISPARGATMLSVLLGCAFLSRQFWGWLADRAGGLVTVLAGSTCQALALAAFVVTQDEVGLFVVSAAFGLGFSGIIPAYVVALRELFPADEASWRVPVWFFTNLLGMTLGGWLAGYLYDQLASYGPAFAVGVAFNLGNVAVIGWLVLRQRSWQPRVAAAA
ncbi:MAG: MFS transporter [Proteobacteria bacterium]|nr:MFS transporter [Pseudomonadota bacterium]